MHTKPMKMKHQILFIAHVYFNYVSIYLMTWLMHRITGSSLFDNKAWRTCITMLTQIISPDAVIMRTVIMHPISCRDLITAKEIPKCYFYQNCIPTWNKGMQLLKRKIFLKLKKKSYIAHVSLGLHKCLRDADKSTKICCRCLHF